MRKFLYWLLVILFPLAGLVAGMWLTPRNEPLWKYTSEEGRLLGTADDGMTVLVLEKSTSLELSFVGIGTSTGLESYRILLSDEQLHGRNVWYYLSTMSPDGKYVVLLSKHLTDSRRQQIVLYSVQKRVVTNRFDMELDDIVFELGMSGNTIAAYCSDSKILLQDALDPEKKQWIPWYKGEHHGLSLDGLMHYEITSMVFNSESRLHCYDVGQSQVIADVSLHCHCQLLNCLSNSHVEVINEDSNDFLLVSSYVRTGNSIQHDPSRDRKLQAPHGWKSALRTILPEFLVISYSNDQHPVRTWLHSWNIETLSKLTETVWPTQLQIELVNRTSMKAEHRLQMHDGEFGVLPAAGMCYGAHGIAYQFGQHVYFWQFREWSRFIPLLGLATGCLMSLMMLVRRFWKPLITRPASPGQIS